MKRTWPQLVVMLGALAALSSCRRGIGDDCITSTDCDPNGTGICNLSQPGGYCTVEGCDDQSCPDNSVCIRSFPAKYLTTPCDPLCEDIDCAAGRTDACGPEELCLDVGLCSRRAFERRLCARSCGNNGDCRGGYECRPAGTRGSMALVSSPESMPKFCAPAAD